MTGKSVKTRDSFCDHMTRFVLQHNEAERWFPADGPALQAVLEKSLRIFFGQVAERVSEPDLENRSWKEAERNTMLLFKSMAHLTTLGSPRDILDQMNQHYQVNLRRLGVCPLWPFC